MDSYQLTTSVLQLSILSDGVNQVEYTGFMIIIL